MMGRGPRSIGGISGWIWPASAHCCRNPYRSRTQPGRSWLRVIEIPRPWAAPAHTEVSSSLRICATAAGWERYGEWEVFKRRTLPARWANSSWAKGGIALSASQMM